MFETFALTNQDLFFQTYKLSGQSQMLDGLMIFAADYLIIIVLLLTIFLALTKSTKEKKAFLIMLLSFGIAFLLIKTIGKLIEEPRPFVKYDLQPLISFAPNDAFPSDHTIMLTIIFLSFYYYRSKFAPIFLFTIIWTGFARVFVGVHYPGDILGGFLFGLVSVYLAVKIKNYLLT